MGVLVLKRRYWQRVFLDIPPGFAGGRVTVQVVEASRGYTRLAVDAPEEVKVWREELLSKAEAAETVDDAEFREGLA